MPLPDKAVQAIDLQTSFIDGMECRNPGDQQFVYGLNVSLRKGVPETRAGIRRAYTASVAGLVQGFWFPFTFPFKFVKDAWAGVTGVGSIRLPGMSEEGVIYVGGGTVYLQDSNGYARNIACSETLDSTEEQTFLQANNFVFMFRGEERPPLYWNGSSSTGFITVPDATTPGKSSIPWASRGVYAFGRIWVWYADNHLSASEILDFTNWDQTYEAFKLGKFGDGDRIVSVVPFKSKYLLAFREGTIYVLTLSDLNYLSGEYSSGPMTIQLVENMRGAVGPDAMVEVGQQMWFLSKPGGIFKITYTNEGSLQTDAVPVSAPIQSLINRINWDYADRATMTFANNYVMCAVPIDGHTNNNALLVFDRLAGSEGGGAWCGLWHSEQTKVRKFFFVNRELHFFGHDAIVRKMFIDGNAKDSSDPVADTPDYDADEIYHPGMICKRSIFGEWILYRALQQVNGVMPTGSNQAQWEIATDHQHVYDLTTEIVTRWIRASEAGGKTWGKTEILLKHSNAKVSLNRQGEGDPQETAIYTDREWSRTGWDVAGKTERDETNVDLDFLEPGRPDYYFYLTSAGIRMNSSGTKIGVMASHPLVFLPIINQHRAIRFRIKTTRGRICIVHILVYGQYEKHAWRLTV